MIEPGYAGRAKAEAGARLILDAGVEAVEDAGHAHKHRGPQRAHVVHECLGRALPVADLGADAEEELLRDAVKDVREGQVREKDVLRPASAL